MEFIVVDDDVIDLHLVLQPTAWFRYCRDVADSVKSGGLRFFDPTVEDRLQFFLNAVDGSIPTRVVEHQALHTLLDCCLVRTNQRSRPPGALASGPLASPRGVIIL